MGTLKTRLANWAKSFKQQTLVVYFAARDPRTPLSVRLLAILVAAYALRPIDLIPDFIPVIGYRDDLILLPLGIALIVKLTPPDVIRAAKERAAKVSELPNELQRSGGSSRNLDNSLSCRLYVAVENLI